MTGCLSEVDDPSNRESVQTKERFDYLDTDRSGTIDEQEYRRWVRCPNGLSGWALAAVICGVVVGLAALAGWWFWTRMGSSPVSVPTGKDIEFTKAPMKKVMIPEPKEMIPVKEMYPVAQVQVFTDNCTNILKNNS